MVLAHAIALAMSRAPTVSGGVAAAIAVDVLSFGADPRSLNVSISR
jgi:hypothetical protein